MERAVIYRNDQKIIADDLNNGGLFTRQSFDTIVADAISSLRYFTGFAVSKTGQTEITVAAGHYWGGAAVYRRDDATVFNVLTGGNYMPVTTKRIVAVVTYGDTIETDTQQRSFLIDDQGTTEPQSVAMESLRYAHLALVAGVEGPDPQKPTLDAGVIPVAWVTLTTSGVADGGIEMATDYQLPSVESLSQLIKAIEAWRTQIGQLLNTILSELVRIQAAIPPDMSSVILALLERIEALEARTTVPTTTDPIKKTFVDRFRSLALSNTGHADYNAVVDNGLTFPGGTVEQVGLALNNPLDPKVKTLNGVLLPVWTEERTRLEIGSPDSQLALSQYTVQTVTRVQKMLSRTVTKYSNNIVPILATGAHADTEFARLMRGVDVSQSVYDTLLAQVKALDANLQRTITFDFKRVDGEPYTLSIGPSDWSTSWYSARLSTQVVVQEPYWEYVTKDATINGSQVAQTFLNATNGWMTSVDIPFSQVGAAGNVNVFICEVDMGGRPKKSHVIGRGVIDVADLVTTEHVNCVLESPVYMQGGQSYAIMLVTTGNHYVRVRTGNKYISGAAFYLSDTAEWLAVQNSGDIALKLNYAMFDSTRVEVLLEPLTRAGGISAIKLAAAQWEPDGTNLSFEIQRAGIWYQLNEGEFDALSGSPTLVNLRMVFSGTRDLMPGIDMLQTEATLSKTELEFEHWSTACAVGVATSSVEVHLFVRGWDAAAHTLACTISTAGDGVLAAASTEVRANHDDEMTRQVVFTFAPTAETEFEIVINGETTDADNTFVIVRREAFAL